MDHCPAIIAGGGIAGLAVALALRGRDGLILERSETFSAVGAGLQLGPNAIRALQKLAAWEAVSAITSSPPEIHIRDGLTGKCLKRLALGSRFEKQFGAPYRVAQRADLHAALLEVVKSQPNLTLRMAAQVNWARSNNKGVELQVGGEVLRRSQLWAVDGVHSAIRQALVPGSAPIDSGARFHRALLAINLDVKNVALDCVNLWMFPGGHVVHYPVGTPQCLNVVAVVPDGTTPQTYFANACSGLRNIISHLDDASIWPGLYVNPLPTWQFGNITLLGDAAHGTLPYLAQGAAMALEDAAAIVGIAGESSLAEAIKQRQRRTALLHQKTLSAGRTYHLNGIMGTARNTAIALSPGRFLQNQLGWIYRHY